MELPTHRHCSMTTSLPALKKGLNNVSQSRREQLFSPRNNVFTIIQTTIMLITGSSDQYINYISSFKDIKLMRNTLISELPIKNYKIFYKKNLFIWINCSKSDNNAIDKMILWERFDININKTLNRKPAKYFLVPL